MGKIVTLILLVAFILFFLNFERAGINSKQIALISALSAVAALGRIPFAGIPNVQPTTFIVIISGYVIGPRAGFMTGAAAALISNFFLGQGPWTPWQMLAWGTAGTTAGLLGILRPSSGRIQLMIFCGIWGYLFGWIMNLWTWVSYTYPHNFKTYLVLCLASFWFDTLHAIGNIVLAWLLGKEFLSIISRFKKKMIVEYLKYDNNPRGVV